MKRLFPLFVLLAAVLFYAPAARAQETPTYCCGPTFTYCDAKTHQHGQTATAYYIFVNNGLAAADECNTTGDFFLGNTIKVRQWSQTATFWYNWHGDPRGLEKLAVWKSTPWTSVMVEYDPVCMMALKVTSADFPD